jgi:hypothetical protein
MKRNPVWTTQTAAGSRGGGDRLRAARVGAWRRAALAWLLLAGCAARQAPHAAARVAGGAPYDTAATRPAVLGDGDAPALADAVGQAARDAGFELRGDGRLARLAQLLPPASELETRARELGLVETAISAQRFEIDSDTSPNDALQASVREMLRSLRATHFGVFVEARSRAVRVVLARRPLTLAPIARTYAVGASVIVRGRLEPPYRNPKLIVSGPSGTLTLPAGEGPGFELQVPLREAGSYRLALHARAAQDSEALAELSVNAGTAAPAQAPADAVTPGALARALYARTAALRTAHGLPPLQADARLQLRADRDSAALAAGAAPAAPPEQRGGLMLRTLARGRDEAELWSALVADGGMRAQLLSAEVTHVGIGVARTGDGFVATHVLARLAPGVDDDLAPARVLAALNQNRVARTAPALRPDPQLTRVARDAAHAFFAHPERSEREILDQANGELDRFRLAYARVAALALVVIDPLEAAALEPALDPAARAVGVAVARGERPDADPGSVAVVLALGWDRPP